MSSTKAKQRKKLLQERSKLSKGGATLISKKVCDSLYGLQNWSTIANVHTYLPIEEKNEINTWPLIKKLWADNREVKVYTSIYGANRALQHVIINENTKFEQDELGIPVPTGDFLQEAVEYDLIIVPTLGFDESLNRLGYGRGVYDTFLSKYREARKIGLAYESAKLEQIDIESHDVPLDVVVTEERCYLA